MTEQLQQESVKLETKAAGKVISRLVPYSSLKDVEFYSGYTELLSNPYSRVATTAIASEELVFPFPPNYARGFDRYASYLITKSKMSTDELAEAFRLAHHLGDDDYLSDLITDGLLSDWKLYSSVLRQLPVDLQVDIYHHLPYSLIPAELANQYSFFQEWVRINGEKPSFSVIYDAVENPQPEIHTCGVASRDTGERVFIYQIKEVVSDKNQLVPQIEEEIYEDNQSVLIYNWYDDQQLGNPIELKYESFQHGERGDILDIWIEWYKTGQVSRETVNTEINTTEIGYHMNGNKYMKSVFDMKTGRSITTKYYDNQGNTIHAISDIGTRGDDRLASHKEWSSDGQLIAEGHYKSGKKVGVWQELQDGEVVYNLYDNNVLVRSSSSPWSSDHDLDS